MPSNEAIARGTQKIGVVIALQGGRQGERSSYLAKWEPYCDNPVRLERRITSREATNGVKMGNLKLADPLRSMEVAALVPCRRCVKCLQWRQMKWRERALQEIVLANRTWFVTLTFSPTHLAGVLLEAKGSDHKHVEAAAYPHVQRFVKRLRKLKCQFRYLAIYERGEKTGRSHYHLFLHEIGNKPVLKEQIESQWRSFVHARLVRGNEAGRNASYLTKYATKSFDIRPRASNRYGKNLFSPIPLGIGGMNTLFQGVKKDDAQQ